MLLPYPAHHHRNPLSDENLRDLHSAAWRTFLVFSHPNVRILHILSEEYSRAIEQLGSIPSERWLPADPDRRLAEHLATFYWWGVLNLSDPEGLLQRFYARASDTLRAHALGFLGRNLHRISGEVPTENVEHLQVLWQSRLRAAEFSYGGSRRVRLLVCFRKVRDFLGPRTTEGGS